MPVQLLNQRTRDEIYKRTMEAVMREFASDDPRSLCGQCLEFAYQGYQVLKDWPGAPRTIIQAGSASWPRLPPEMDDGIVNTHFSYVWEPESELTQLVMAGMAPLVRRADGRIAYTLAEMHVWLAFPDTGELIDFTTGFWPTACELMTGEEWFTQMPPYFWHHKLPDRVIYAPHPRAIDCVSLILARQGRVYP